MCGLAGVVFGARPRRRGELEHLLGSFTKLLTLSQARGTDATGAAIIREDGSVSVAKAPVPATEFLRAFNRWLGRSLMTATVPPVMLMGHTRYATRGTARQNINNHPIVAGHVIGTHNGTIQNADDVFKARSLLREAEVDSEVLFRLAEAHQNSEGDLDVEGWVKSLEDCLGNMAVVAVALTDPQHVIFVRGGNPLFLAYSQRRDALLYASEARFLTNVIAKEKDTWEVWEFPGSGRRVRRAEPARTTHDPVQLRGVVGLHPPCKQPARSRHRASHRGRQRPGCPWG